MHFNIFYIFADAINSSIFTLLFIFIMTNETTEKTAPVNTPLNFTLETATLLKSAAKWSYFLSIIGFITILLLVVSGITLFALSTVKNEYADFQQLPVPFLLEIMGVLYLFMGVLYFFPSYNLMKFGSKIKLAFKINDQAALEEGLKNLKRMFTFMGILTLVSITMFVLFIFTSIVFRSVMPVY